MNQTYNAQYIVKGVCYNPSCRKESQFMTSQVVGFVVVDIVCPICGEGIINTLKQVYYEPPKIEHIKLNIIVERLH